MVMLPGALMLQIAVPCSAQIARTASGSMPSTAAMVPRSASQAACIRPPRSRTSRTPSSKGTALAAISAAYSPSEWPATKAGRWVIVPASTAATSAAIACTTSAGCVFTV